MSTVEFKEQVELLIKGEINSFVPGNLSPQTIEDQLLELGFELMDREINGWEVIFWIDFKKDLIKLVYSGNWYRGMHSITKNK